MQADKRVRRAVASYSRGGFRQFVNDNTLIDLGFKGANFTWCHRRSGGSNVQERLDHGFANAPWKLHFDHASITLLPALQSDQKRLLFQYSPKIESLPNPFKFETFWTTILEAALIIQKAWERGHTLSSKIENTKTTLRQWNKEGLGNIHTKIEHPKASIQKLQEQQQTDASLA